MKTLKNTKFLLITLISITLFSCSKNDDEIIPEEEVIKVDKNTAKSSTVNGNLNHFSIHNTGTYYTIVASEKMPTSIQNPDWGIKIDLIVKELPTQTVTLNHRVEPDFNLQTGEYYFNTADLVSEKWYVPFINSRPSAKLEIKIENSIATFTVFEAELSDNFVAPITKTDKISVSFSIPISGFNLTNNTSTGDLTN